MHSFINHVQRISRWDPGPKMLLYETSHRHKENRTSDLLPPNCVGTKNFLTTYSENIKVGLLPKDSKFWDHWFWKKPTKTPFLQSFTDAWLFLILLYFNTLWSRTTMWPCDIDNPSSDFTPITLILHNHPAKSEKVKIKYFQCAWKMAIITKYNI